ncbi:MAG TPA: hypothetical protein VK306_03380 [Acidimicrobiales bacterium]|nr:hypothetical protein [Acidimicrobiales bacterium]
MSAVAAPVASAPLGATVERRSILALAGVEARRNLRSPLLLVVLAFSALSVLSMNSADWSGGTYADLPLYFVPLAGGTFFLGLRSAGRDHRADVPPLAEDCALDEPVRMAGRLLGLAVFPAIAAAGVLVVEVASRIEGGYWIGDAPWRTDTALHTPFELLQPIALVAFAGAAGVAAGRRFRHRTPIAVLAGVMTFLSWGAYWVFQWPPMFVVSFVQTQPISQWAGPASAGASSFPDHWLVSYDDYERFWARQYVDQALAGGHVLYLIGLTVLCVGFALRVRGGGAATPPAVLWRRLRWIGWACVAGGILIQLWSTGFALTPGGTGEGQIP